MHFFNRQENCISEFSKIKKKEIPEKFIIVLKGDTEIVPERRTFNINNKLNF